MMTTRFADHARVAQDAAINGLSLKEVRAAIALGTSNLDSVTPEYKPELERRLTLLRDRGRRLAAAEKQIRQTTGAGESEGFE
jgi:hypothetical protein